MGSLPGVQERKFTFDMDLQDSIEYMHIQHKESQTYTERLTYLRLAGSIARTRKHEHTDQGNVSIDSSAENDRACDSSFMARRKVLSGDCRNNRPDSQQCGHKTEKVEREAQANVESLRINKMMELDELRNRWSSLDERLKKQEALKENIIKKMMYEKAGKSQSKLLNYGIFGTVLYVGTAILLIYILLWMRFSPNPEYVSKTLFMQILLLVFIVGFIISVTFQIKNLILLNKINYSNPMKINIEYAEQYRIRSRKLTMVIYAVFVPLFAILLIAMGSLGIFGMKHWTFILFLIIAASVYSIWEYKKFYMKNIQIIQESLNELKELEEE